ncbi:carbamoyltransferase family protein [Tunicatimonas pelagia]|uniref:carbamoyltransferase family protein n=1 Tax=Tunicatimonas pelagia TaxID=931531 RepID=UPI00266603D6|nr:carbamoyltransferase [Tunicatimonas pelagia]WKN41446.1 carbamoyltransferase [Tunicatimonas pelagia]
MRYTILGISAFYHDSAAALVIDGRIIAAAQEERFTRIKHDASFPIHAIRYVLAEASVDIGQVHSIIFYDKPLLKFERLLETYHAIAPRGLTSFLTAIPVWVKDKLFLRRLIRRELVTLGKFTAPIQFTEHHLSHAASTFYPSPFEEATILTIDGVGEWATTTISHGQGNQIRMLRELHFPHSVGLLYSAFTYYLGFKVNGGEYKLMGLAPYGNPTAKQTQYFREKISSELVSLKEDGSIQLDMSYFKFMGGLRMTDDRKWNRLFGIPRRSPESEILPEYTNLALAIQQVTEKIVLRLATTARSLTQSKNLTMAGGVALNSVANGKLLDSGLFDNIWIQPAAGDAGGALGAALAGWYIGQQAPRTANTSDSMQGAYLGPSFTQRTIEQLLYRQNIGFTYYENFVELAEQTARLLADGKVVGWFQGRMEFGPRALGNRSILADARHPEMQLRLNQKVKFRENFRPFAPSVLQEDAADYFDLDVPSPYMLLVRPVLESRRCSVEQLQEDKDWRNQLAQARSDIPAVTHVDYSARIQTVDERTNPRFAQLLRAFKKQTGYSLLVNTSFNVRDEPIVCTPADALRCFQQTEMDALVMENFLVIKQ